MSLLQETAPFAMHNLTHPWLAYCITCKIRYKPVCHRLNVSKDNVSSFLAAVSEGCIGCVTLGLMSSSFASKVNLLGGKTVCDSINGQSPLPSFMLLSSRHLFLAQQEEEIQNTSLYLKITIFNAVVLSTSNLFSKLLHERQFTFRVLLLRNFDFQRSFYTFVNFFFSCPALPKRSVAFLKFLLSPQSLHIFILSL